MFSPNIYIVSSEYKTATLGFSSAYVSCMLYTLYNLNVLIDST